VKKFIKSGMKLQKKMKNIMNY